MSEVTIEQMNEAIALFMGGSSIKEHGDKRYVYYPKSCAKDVSELKYHSSWDWLMPVVERIVSMGFFVRSSFHKVTGPSVRIIESTPPGKDNNTVASSYGDKKSITAVYDAVYQFIQWYNKQQSNEQSTKGDSTSNRSL